MHISMGLTIKIIDIVIAIVIVIVVVVVVVVIIIIIIIPGRHIQLAVPELGIQHWADWARVNYFTMSQ